MVDLGTYISPDIDAINETLYEINMEMEKKKDINKTVEKPPHILSDEEIRDLGNNY